jgi:DNA-binding NarL/FixJ family response regulator
MGATTRRDESRDRTDAVDEVLLLCAANDPHRRALSERLEAVPGRARAERGAYPRFRVVAASSGAESLRRAPDATVAMVSLALARGAGLETVRRVREAHAHVPILAYASVAGPSDAIAAVMAGADFFHECKDESSAGLARALDVAIGRRRLTHDIERNEADAERARGRLAELSGELAGTAPGLWPLHAREDILPFREAARRYLLAAVRFHERDPRGLAKALGVSYFALRRLLARYDVPFPAVRPRRQRA